MKKEKRKLSSKILAYITLLALFSMLLVMIGSMVGMQQVKTETKNKIKQVKEIQEAGTEEEIIANIMGELTEDSAALALQYTEKFKQYTQAIEMCASYITNIYENPGQFGEGDILTRNQGMEYDYELYYCMPKSVDSQKAEGEIKRLSAVKSIFTPLRSNLMADAVYFANTDGIMIAMDDNTKERQAEMMDPENPAYFAGYDPRQREWYIRAEESQGNYIFTAVYEDVGGGEVITCSSPVYANGEFKGVVALDFKYQFLADAVVPNSDRDYQQFYQVINEKGEILVRFKEGAPYESINIFGNAEFSRIAQSLKKQSEMSYPEADSNLIYKNIQRDAVLYQGGEYVLAGINLRGTNLYFVLFVDKNQAVDIQWEQLEKNLAPVAEIQEKIKVIIGNMTKTFLVLLAATGIVIVVLSKIVSEKISGPIQRLILDAKEIGEGNLEHKVEIHTGDELETLGEVFNQMTGSLSEYMENLRMATMEQERISTELNVASSIQNNMLPREFPAFPGENAFDICAFMHPAKEVGGDYYDYFMLDNRYLVSVIADVSGKGVPAALFMMMGKTLMHSQASYLNSTADIMRTVNIRLNENNDEMMFITSFLCILDTVTGKLSYTNAGHNPPLLYRREKGIYTYMDEEPDLVLAVLEEAEYQEKTIWLKPGDKLFLYTDGVTETMDTQGALYGDEHLKEVLNGKELAGLSGESLLTALNKNIQEFAFGAAQADDITMMVLSMENYKIIEENQEKRRRLTVAADLTQLDKVLDFVREILKEERAEEEIITKAEFCVDEMFANVANYAYDEMGEVTLDITRKEDRIILYMEDEGIPYNPLEKANPDVDLPVEEREIGGLGIFLVKNTADNIQYCYEDGKNKLTMEVNLQMEERRE